MSDSKQLYVIDHSSNIQRDIKRLNVHQWIKIENILFLNMPLVYETKIYMIGINATVYVAIFIVIKTHITNHLVH